MSSIRVGDIVTIASDGTVQPMRPYTRQERLVRWVGRLLHIGRWATYHERRPLGVYMSLGVVRSANSFMVCGPEGE